MKRITLKNSLPIKYFLLARMPIASILFAICCLVPPVNAQVELSADSNHVETGNPLVFHLRLPITLGKPDTLNFEVWESFLPQQNIVNQTAWQKDGEFISKTLTVLFFDADSILIPPLPVALRNGDTIYANPLQVIVTATPSPDDLNDMANIKEIHREPSDWTDTLPGVLGALLVLAILGLLFWLVKRKAQAKIQSQNFEIPPRELALKKLNVLTQKQLTVHGFVKEHYAELTYILREYLEKRFRIPALESTTEETLGYLKNRDIDDSMTQKLQILLEQADLAKFAKIIPPESFHTEALELAKKIILETSTAIEPQNPPQQQSSNPQIPKSPTPQ